MSAFQTLHAKVKSVPYDPDLLSESPQLNYMLSLSDYPILESSHFHPKDTYQSPLNLYAYANFDDTTYDQLLDQTLKNYKSKNGSVLKGIRSNFKQYFMRISAMTHDYLIQTHQNKNKADQNQFDINCEQLQYRIQSMKGNIPSKWPEGLKDFEKELQALPWNAFSTDSQVFLEDFIQKLKESFANKLKKYCKNSQNERKTILINLSTELCILVGISLRTTNQKYILHQLNWISKIFDNNQFKLTQNEETFISQCIVSELTKVLSKIPKSQKLLEDFHTFPIQLIQHNKKNIDRQGFLIMKKIHFQKINGLNFYSITTDGKYIYIYVSAINGGMFKIGTGNQQTLKGKIYFQKLFNLPVGTKLEQISWVYLKRKLYLKIGSREPSSLEVINSETFQRQKVLNLSCESLFGHNILNILNKNSPLLTDGQNLYILGKRIKIIQKQTHKNVQKTKTQQKKQDGTSNIHSQKKQKKKKKKNQQQDSNNNNQQNQNINPDDSTSKILQIVLVQFKVNSQADVNDQYINTQAINQIFQSFSGYFTLQECKKAYIINNQNLMETCQWLFDQGNKQKQKNINIVPAKKITVICQSEITSNFNEKLFKSPVEIVTKEDSLIHLHNINESIWTMSKKHITCYSQAGIKIFNKNDQSYENNQELKGKEINNQSKVGRLHNTLIKKYDSKFVRNPEYNIIYDPYNQKFYTFVWPSDGHYFPTAIFVAHQKKNLIQEKLQLLQYEQPKKICQIPQFFIHKINLLLLDKSYQWKANQTNDILWSYGQKIIKIGQQMKPVDSDKKKLSNKRSKIFLKMNRINQLQKRYASEKAEFAKNGKVVKEIIKLRPFSNDGSLQIMGLLKIIFKNIQNTSSNQKIQNFILVVKNWFTNCSARFGNQIQNQISLTSSWLLKIKDAPSTSQQNRSLINEVFIQFFDLIFKSSSSKIKFITSLTDQQIASKIINFNGFSHRKESIIYEITNKDLIISKYESKFKFQQVFPCKSIVKPQEPNIFSKILLRTVDQNKQAHAELIVFLQKIIVRSKIGSQMLKYLFIQALLYINNELQQSKNKEKSVYLIKYVNLFQDTLKIIQKSLSSFVSSKFNKILQLIPLIKLIIEVYHSSLAKLSTNSNIIKSIIKIIQYLYRPEFIQICSFLQKQQFQGVSSTNQTIYETAHPIQRGKNHTFPNSTIDQACLLYLQFDKRCQSDPNNDVMTIQLLHQNNPVGNSIPCNDGTFSTNIRLTGKVQAKRPTLILGNSLCVDFTSGGHAKDAQSFGRYGFKFGVKPVYGGKINYKNNCDQKRIEKSFGEKKHFQQYFNTVKLLVVGAASAIQGLLTNSETQIFDSQIKSILKGKIMRQGLQEGLNQIEDEKQSVIGKIVLKYMNNLNQLDAEKQILKNKNFNSLEKLVAQIQHDSSFKKSNIEETKSELWSVQSLPSYIKGYIEEIRMFHGDFIQVFKQAREHAPAKGTYSLELRKQSFNQQCKQLWLQGEALLFLTVLKHSGLLHLNLKFSIQYIKQNLKAFQQARNQIYDKFISKIQTVKEWRQMIKAYHFKEQEQIQQKKQQNKRQKNDQKNFIIKKGKTNRTIKIQNKTVTKNNAKIKNQKIQQVKNEKEKNSEQKLKQVEKQIRQRLTNEYLTKKLCQYKKIKYVQGNQFQAVNTLIELLKKQKQNIEESVYIKPMQHLIKCCLFLLSFKSPSTKQSLQEDETIVPMNMGRSLSSDHRNANANKVQLFRQWLQNWKKWKGFKKQNKIQLKFPVEEIQQFISKDLDIQKIKQTIMIRSRICESRQKFYKFLAQLTKIVQPSPIIAKYLYGMQAYNIHQTYQSNLEATSLPRLNLLSQSYKLYVSNLKDSQKFIIQSLPLTLQKFRKQISIKGVKGTLNSIKNLLINLVLVQNQNPQINIEIILFFISLRYAHIANEELIFLCSVLIQRAYLTQYSLTNLVQILKKQVGNNQVAAMRWKDLLFIQRIKFLLIKIQMIFRKKGTNIPIDQKNQAAQAIYYLLIWTDVPLLSRIALKILKKIPDINLNSLKTPYSQEYKILQLVNKQLRVKEVAKVKQNLKKHNNSQLLSKKCLKIFESSIQPQQLFLSKLEFKNINSSQMIAINEKKVQKYNIILNLHKQEDLAWFIRVLFYLQELERQSNPEAFHQLKDYQQYLEAKNKKKQQNAKKQVPKNQVINQQKQNNILIQKERIFCNIPDQIMSVQEELQGDLPIAWFFNYCAVYSKFSDKEKSSFKKSTQNIIINPQNSNPNIKQPRNRINNQNNTKKVWASPIYSKLVKKIQQLNNNKTIEQPKQGDSAQIKSQFVMIKNFLNRLRRSLFQTSIIITQLSQNGFYLFKENLTKEKAIQLCQIIAYGIQGRLKPISNDFIKNNDWKTKINIIQDVASSPSKMKISLINSQNYRVFEEMINTQSHQAIIQNSSLNLNDYLNKNELTLTDASYLPFEIFPKIQESSLDFQMQFAKQFIDSEIFKMKKRQEQVYLVDYPKLSYNISQGGLQSGLKEAVLLPTSESLLTLQNVQMQNVHTHSLIKQKSQCNDFPQQIIEKVIAILTKKIEKDKPIKQNTQIIDYLLASFYLKKLSKLDLTFVDKMTLKSFGKILVDFSEGFKSFQPINYHEAQVQKLLIKLMDSHQPNIKMFQTFYSADYQVSPSIANYISAGQNQNENIQFTEANQKLETYHYPKSEYLLRSQPPQIQENKLLKYWQKNILPKIYEFVKTTLKPIQIQDFFEQMRIPLRKNNQTQAKKIAFVICDNKLPQGAVLPDANHNWNSFSLQDIQVGQYALYKLPKSISNQNENCTPLMARDNQEYRLVKIIYIDIKNNRGTANILVRYRMEEYGIAGYMWVSMNNLVQVEKQIMHIPLLKFNFQIERNLKGLIYGYSKQCLTQLTSTSISDELDQQKLIKQTILDLFIDNPISGWLNKNNKNWSMKNVLKKMLINKNLEIINYLEKNFCPVKSYNLNLLNEKTLKLNRFQDARALIISFKKTSMISLTSGLKFYSDQYKFKQICHIYTTKNQKNEFQPLQFNDPNVFSQYYTNKDCLKISDQNKYKPVPIQVTIFGIQQIWTIGCYLGQVISQIAQNQKKIQFIQILGRLNKLYINWILQKKVSVLCSYLSKLICKITHRLIKLCELNNVTIKYQTLGVTQENIKGLINWVSELLNQQEQTTLCLYSSLLQNLSEMCATILMKINNVTIPLPQHLQAMINLLNKFNEIQQHLKGKQIINKYQSSNQWQRLLQINNIPHYINSKQLKQKVKVIIKQNKGKILCPKYDLFHRQSEMIILVEGWNTTDLVQEDIIQKIQKEQQEQKNQEQDQGLMMEWGCQECTFINSMGNSHCEVCGAVMPAPVQKQQIYQKVQATDVNKAQTKLRQKQKKMFETIKQQILNYFNDKWTQYKQKQKPLQNQNNEQKPQIILKTGSDVLKSQLLQAFLQNRWKQFPDKVKKLVDTSHQSNNNEHEIIAKQSFIQIFKKIQVLGYDLWSDQIYNQNPRLIPFASLYQLMNYVQGQICKGSSSVLSYSQSSIRILSSIPLLESLNDQQSEPVNYQIENDIGIKVKYKSLAEFKSYSVRYSWKIVKEINVAASKCLQFINMNLSHYSQTDTLNSTIESLHNQTLGTKLKYFRNLIMGTIKLQLYQKIIQKTSISRQSEQTPKIILQRLRVRQDRSKHKAVTIKDKQQYLFTKAHEQFLKTSTAYLRPFKPKGTDPYISFNITFRGQNAMGQTGPYRQFFTDISNELDPKSHLGLFIKTPNNVHKQGQAKSKWCVNPKANSSYHLSLFEYIGVLMGCCLRTGTHMALDLPKIFWKCIVGQPISDRDIQEVDVQLLSKINLILNIPDQETFNQLQELSGYAITWTYKTSDDQQHQLIFNGHNIKVQYDDREAYVKQIKQKRIYQSSLQIKRIKKGLQQLIPQAYLNCLSGDQLKLAVCGRPKVDIQLLKKHTKYAGGLTQEDRRIKFFWEIMKDLDQSQKLKIIKFCWGQERLPMNSQQFQRNNIRFMIKPMMNNKSNHDQALPKADTCFFNIELPNYSTKQIMREKILLAINLDNVSINADQIGHSDDNPLMNQIQEGVYDDEEENQIEQNIEQE